jgi:hypothetical protein
MSLKDRGKIVKSANIDYKNRHLYYYNVQKPWQQNLNTLIMLPAALRSVTQLSAPKTLQTSFQCADNLGFATCALFTSAHSNELCGQNAELFNGDVGSACSLPLGFKALKYNLKGL